MLPKRVMVTVRRAPHQLPFDALGAVVAHTVADG